MRIQLAAGLVGSWLLTGGMAWAHGTVSSVEQATTVRVVTEFDTGEPLDAAQVVVYSPSAPDQPWTTGTTDASGTFEFAPPPDEPGNWQVVVRKAGHGETVTIPVGTGATGTTSGSLSPVQKALTGVAVIWGCVGTALFFAQSRKTAATAGAASGRTAPNSARNKEA